MAVTVGGTAITFNDGTTQSTAAGGDVIFVNTTPDTTSLLLNNLPSSAKAFNLAVGLMTTNAPTVRYPVLRPYSAAGMIAVVNTASVYRVGSASATGSVYYQYNNTVNNLTYTESTTCSHGYQVYIQLVSITGSTYNYISYFLGSNYSGSTYSNSHLVGWSNFSSSSGPLTALEVALSNGPSTINLLPLNGLCQLSLRIS